MGQSIRFFGGTTHGQITVENGHSETWTFDRDVWFDRDIDGRWLVWAGRHNATALPDEVEGEGATGAIVVKDPTVIAFIDLLGELIADPARFRDEPTFSCPRDDETPRPPAQR